MKASALSAHSGIEMDIAHVVVKAMDNPDTYMQKLWEIGSGQQWNNSDMNWSKIDLSTLPLSVRQSLANIFTQIHFGEITAFIGASALVKNAPNHWVKKIATIQAADEGRHIKWFATLMDKLGCQAEVLPSIRKLMESINSETAMEDKSLGMHLLVESIAHTVFYECSKAVCNMPFFHKKFTAYGKLMPVFGDWLPNYLLKDEEMHLNFGILFLKDRLSQLTAKRLSEIEKKVQYWGEIFLEIADDPTILAFKTMDSQVIGTKCISDINSRLRKVGLKVQIPILKSLNSRN